MAESTATELLRARPALTVVRDPGRLPEPRDGEHSAEIDGARVTGRDELFDALARELRFPEWFGRNWDALNDCLRDLSWLDSAGVVLAVRDADEMLRQAPRASAHLLEIWSGASLSQAERGQALQLFLELGE